MKLSISLSSFSLLCIYYIIKAIDSSIILKALYIIPFFLCVIYCMKVEFECKISNYKKIKNCYKASKVSLALIWFYIYIMSFIMEFVLLERQSNKMLYLLIFLMISCCEAGYTFFKGSDRFINNFQFKNIKFNKTSKICESSIVLLVCIINFHKPYKLILIGILILMIILVPVIVNLIFEYKQYDKIQELKKQINYIPPKKK